MLKALSSKLPTNLSLEGLIHLLVVYVAWGSTFLAIRVAVGPGGGFPPFTMGAIRTLLAGMVLLGWAFLSGKRVLPERKDLPVLIGSGVLLWSLGNGMVVFAEKYVDSGIAALMVNLTPIWIILLNALINHELPHWLLWCAIAAGSVGLGFIVGSNFDLLELKTGNTALIALLWASFSFALGMLLQNKFKPSLDTIISSAYQNLFGGLGFVLLAIFNHEAPPNPSIQGLLAVGYLTLIGSVISFTSFTRALSLLPISVTMTYSYVNPVVALLIGSLFLHEEIGWVTVVGAILMLVAVFGAFKATEKSKDRST
ncbi:MAG: EamA family transporter [Candidatus Caenarcaniphilales bacterium]|nr:EamA family transporter [Candidatus Caenarcaniphilales bacterium]